MSLDMSSVDVEDWVMNNDKLEQYQSVGVLVDCLLILILTRALLLLVFTIVDCCVQFATFVQIANFFVSMSRRECGV